MMSWQEAWWLGKRHGVLARGMVSWQEAWQAIDDSRDDKGPI
ncbi:hypothetical protein N9485_03015 [Luminiphilus sp.]|nr:hypothetical protein [Luminiphilus sp.]